MSKYKPFSLSEGDTVLFQTVGGDERLGTLVKRPYGRRLYAIVRDHNMRLHYVPERGRIIAREPFGG